MARTLTMALNMSQIERLIVRPIEDMLTVENDDFTMKNVDEEYEDMPEGNMGFKKRIIPVITIEETEDNVLLDRNLTYDDGAKKWDQISEHETGILVDEAFEIEENPHIDIKEKEERKEVINWRLAPVGHAAIVWNRELQMNEVQMDEPCIEQSYMEQPHTEQSHAEQPHTEQPHVELLRVDESQDLQVINSVTMTSSSILQTQDSEFKTIEEIKEEEQRLMTEIERRGELQKTINERVARIKKMREFLEKFDNIEETEAKEENVEIEKRLNEAIEAYLATGEQSKNFSDKFTIVDNNGQSMCEASMVVTLKDKRLRKNIRENKTYRITYDITGSQINRSYCVFTDDDTTSSQTSKARKRTEVSRSEIITRSMMSLRRNLPTISNSNEGMQLRKRRDTQWSLRNRKTAYKSKKRKENDRVTHMRNEKGRFVKKNL